MVQQKIVPEQTGWSRRKLRFTNAEYLQLLESGFYRFKPRYELLEEEIFEVDNIEPKHAFAVNELNEHLEVYRDPKGSDYLTRTTLQPGTPAKARCLSEAIQWE